MSDSVKSKAITAFLSGLEAYAKETKKDAKQALADKALDVAWKVFFRAKKAAPSVTPDGTAFKGYNVKVRKRIARKHGALDAQGEDYRGRVKIRRKGKTLTNKRAAAVADELAVRRSSVKFIAKTIPRWKKGDNKVPDGAVKKLLGESFTRRRKSKTGEAKAEYKKNSAAIKIKAEPKKGKTSPELQKVLTEIEVGGVNDSRLNMSQYLAKRQGRAIGRNMKKVYRAK